MKTIVLFLVLLSTIVVSAQGPTGTRDYYLAKSKNQKTMGWIMLAGGAGLAITGIIVGNGDNNNDPNELDFGPNFDVGLWFLGGGLAVAAGSIPFFVSSANNARRAASVSIINQKVLIPQANKMVAKGQPAISLRIDL